MHVDLYGSVVLCACSPYSIEGIKCLAQHVEKGRHQILDFGHFSLFHISLSSIVLLVSVAFLDLLTLTETRNHQYNGKIRPYPRW